MNMPPLRRLPWRPLACLAVLSMTAVVGLSAFLRHDAAGLGCVPWPVCQGAGAMAADPRWVDAARAAHRVVATLVLLLALALAVQTHRARPGLRHQRGLALGLVALALGLAVVGVLTPGSRLPAVSLANLVGGFLMLGLAFRLAAGAGGLGAPASVVAALLLLQVAAGGLVSVSQAGTVCTGLGDCWVRASTAGWALGMFDPWRPSPPPAAVPDAGLAALQFVHRLGALLVAPLVAALAAWACRHGQWRAGLGLAALLASQVALGLIIGAGGLPLPGVLLHNLGSAWLLALALRMA